MLALSLLLALQTAVPPPAAVRLAAAAGTASVTIAWDSGGGPVDGFRILYGPAATDLSSSLDVGPALTGVVPNLVSGVTYFFVVISYLGAQVSPPSNMVSTLVTDPHCAFPLGDRSVFITVTALQLTGSGQGGSKARLDFQISSPGSPVTRVAVKANGQEVSVMSGTDVGNLAGMWFVIPIPVTPPTTFSLSVNAQNAYGCSKETVASETITVQ